MKMLKSIFIFFLVSISFISCEKDDGLDIQLDTLSFEDRINNLNELNQSFINFEKFSNPKNKNLSPKLQQAQKQKLVNSIVFQSKNIFQHLGVDEQEIKDISNGNIDDVYVAFGIALISSYNDSSLNTENKNINFTMIQKGDFGDCLMEATGLNALVALGDSAFALYAGEVAADFAVDAAAKAAFRKAAVKAATKIITRAAGGFGAIVMVAEFTYCMSR